MNAGSVYSTCQVISKLNALLPKEGGWMLHEIVAFSTVSRSTVDRRLRQAMKWGWVDCDFVDYKGGTARLFRLAGRFQEMDDIPF